MAHLQERPGQGSPGQEKKRLVLVRLAPVRLVQERKNPVPETLAQERLALEKSLALARRVLVRNLVPEKRGLGESLVLGNPVLERDRALEKALVQESPVQAEVRRGPVRGVRPVPVRDQDLARGALEAHLHLAYRVLEVATPLVAKVVRVVTTSLLRLACWTLRHSSVLGCIFQIFLFYAVSPAT